MRRLLATVVAVVVLVRGSDRRRFDGVDADGANGVTKDEIKIGITYPDLEAMRQRHQHRTTATTRRRTGPSSTT